MSDTAADRVRGDADAGGWAHPRVTLERGREGIPDAFWGAALPAWAGTRRWRMALRVKRVMDLVLGTLAAIVAAPILLIAAVLIKLDSPGPVFHRMDWVGLRGRRFSGFKLRTMVVGAHRQQEQLKSLNEMTGPAFKIARDPRVTRVGRLLRRTSIDELPQLWSVLRGDMSLVGPRPPQAFEYAAFQPHHFLKLAVTPGLTCLWQVSGRAAIRNYDEWVRLDLEYIGSWSLWLDFKILLRTIPAVVSGRGAH